MLEVTGYTREDLLDTANELLSRPDAKAKGIWPRAAAHLCRQALEATLEELWRTKLPDMSESSMRAQLICLTSYLSDVEFAGRIAYTWSALSTACHHQVYELAPTASEIASWIDTTTRLHHTVTTL